MARCWIERIAMKRCFRRRPPFLYARGDRDRESREEKREERQATSYASYTLPWGPRGTGQLRSKGAAMAGGSGSGSARFRESRRVGGGGEEGGKGRVAIWIAVAVSAVTDDTRTHTEGEEGVRVEEGGEEKEK